MEIITIDYMEEKYYFTIGIVFKWQNINIIYLSTDSKFVHYLQINLYLEI